MASYYNEHDPFAAAWLRELISAGVITDGEVDRRSIVDVHADDLRGFTQCHFFAGIGGWSYALRLASWSDDRPVWTGSCPCQPFSQAGKGAGAADARHLWPEFRRLIAECRPAVVFGEQVASAAGRAWLSGVCADLEALAYRRAGADLCAAGVGAPHIRQRLYWVADTTYAVWRSRAFWGHRAASEDDRCGCWDRDSFHRVNGMYPGETCVNRGLENTNGQRRDWQSVCIRERESRHASTEAAGGSATGELADLQGIGCRQRHSVAARGGEGTGAEGARRGSTNAGGGCWSDLEWLLCRDGKYRSTQPGLFPLAHGVPARVGRLRGYGNAIVPQVAAAFIESYLESRS